MFPAVADSETSYPSMGFVPLQGPSPFAIRLSREIAHINERDRPLRCTASGAPAWPGKSLSKFVWTVETASCLGCRYLRKLCRSRALAPKSAEAVLDNARPKPVAGHPHCSSRSPSAATLSSAPASRSFGQRFPRPKPRVVDAFKVYPIGEVNDSCEWASRVPRRARRPVRVARWSRQPVS